MRVPLPSGGRLIVEVSEQDAGVRRASRSGEMIDAAMDTFQTALQPIQEAAETALDTFRKARPDGIEIEFGVRLNAEAGAVIAKTTAEGHLTVKLTWQQHPEA
ncbi:CU044_2847 family protein [Spongiactinospora sp. 9N601]|uniref:CU044_2847 family protein n=1 Tax=Spongiactinospora sp. 9N601 TaxID=3375149 RepID=UPI0037A28D3D